MLSERSTVGAGTGERGGASGTDVAQETSMPTMAIQHAARYSSTNAFLTEPMLLILLESLGAGLLLVLIVWWTMFHGRNQGERDDTPDDKN